MAKDPAFLFYPNDYIGGTMGMTFEEKGAYIELLMLQFNRGHMTSHMMGQTVGQLLDKLLDKFVKDENGLYYNVRLEEEQNKRKAFTSTRRNNLLGKNQHTKKQGHMTSHMENENINVDSSYISYLEKNHFSKFEQMKMKLGTIDIKQFLEFFENKCIIESQPYDFNKLNARFGILFSNWNKDKKEEPTKQTSSNAPDYKTLRGW